MGGERRARSREGGERRAGEGREWREVSGRGKKVERGELFMYKRGQIYKYILYMYKMRLDIQNILYNDKREIERGRREASDIERGRREASKRGQRVERGELYMYKRGQIYKYKTYLYKNRSDIQIKIV